MVLDFTGLTKTEPFFVEFEETYIHGNTLGAVKEKAPEVLFMHGEKSSDDRNVFLLLREALLARYAISSVAFDFIGHGTTGGNGKKSSLNSCSRQATNIVNACFDSQPFVIVASGMGAYTAIKLTELFPVDGLVLISPKVYAKEKYNNKLGSFTDSVASFPEHWDRTDAWSIVEQFKGSVSVLGTNKNDPLCPGTMSRLYSHAIRARTRQAFEISNGEYSGELLTYCNQTPLELMRLAKVIKQACGSVNYESQVDLV